MLMRRALLLLLLLCGPALGAVTATQDPRLITMSNGVVWLEIARYTGTISAIRYHKDGQTHQIATGPESMYWDANADVTDVPVQPGERAPNKGYYRPGARRDSCELTINTSQRAEVVVKASPTRWFAFEVEYHIILLDGESGWYSYVVFNHPADQPAARLWQTRFVHKVILKDQFDTHFVDDEQIAPIPTAGVARQVMDATFELEDGTIKTKYANSVYWDRALVYGMAGKKLGLWSISASPEYHNGGPVKQGQTVHDNVLLRVMQSSHFGASGVDVARGEAWQKLYGPVFTYINCGDDPKQLFADARTKQKELSSKWPYQWMDHPAYVHARGAVSGTWKLSTGPASDGAWVILAAPGGDWHAQGKSYMFWTRTGADGQFSIANVIPGRYTLYVVGADQPEQFSRDNIEVAAGKTTDVGTLAWTPATHGQRIWQIGTFDRSAAEFRNGDDARHYEMFRRYPEQFPDDVTFIIGRSDLRTDWNYAHWTWYSKTPAWKIQFEIPEASATGTATLTIGIASAQPLTGNRTNVGVSLNGQALDAIRLPKTGTAGYRGSTQDSPYHVQQIRFDAKLLRAGANEIALAHADARRFPKTEETVDFRVGQIMYDALRLELDP